MLNILKTYLKGIPGIHCADYLVANLNAHTFGLELPELTCLI